MGDDIKAAVRRLRRDGYTVTMDGQGHWQVRCDGKLVAVLPATTRNRRRLTDLKTDLKRGRLR